MRRAVDRTEGLDWQDLFNKCWRGVVEFQRGLDLGKNARGSDRLFEIESWESCGESHQEALALALSCPVLNVLKPETEGFPKNFGITWDILA